MANRDFFQNGRWFREITYGSGSTKIVPLDGPYKSNPSIGQGFAERLYNRTPTPFASLEETTLPNLGARSSFNFRPTSASGGQGLFNLPINQLPSSGKVFALGAGINTQSSIAGGGPLTRNFNLTGQDYWYHGTSFKNTSSILSSGFMSNGGAVDTPGGFHDIWFTKDPAVARAYAGNSGSVFRLKLDPWAGDSFGLNTIGKFRGGAEATRIRGTLPFSVFGSQTEVSGPRGFLDNFLKRPESFRAYSPSPSNGFAGNNFIQKSLKAFSVATPLAGNALYIGSLLQRNAQDVNDIGTGFAVLGGGKALKDVFSFAGGKIVDSGLLGYTRDAKGFSILASTGERAIPLRAPGYMGILSGITAAYDIGKAAGADPYRANQAGFDSVLSSAVFGGTIGGPIGAAIGGGTGLLFSGLLNQQGYRSSLNLARSLDAQTASNYRQLISPLGAGASQLLTQKFNQPLSLGQKLARPASNFLDSIYGAAGGVVQAPLEIAGLPTAAAVGAQYELLLKQGERQAGIFKGVGLQRSAEILGSEISSGSSTDPGLKNFADAAYGRRGGLAGAFNDIERALEQGQRDQLKNVRMSYNQRTLLENAGSYQVATGLANAASRNITNIAREIIKKQTQINTPLVAPSDPRTLESYNWKTGMVQRYTKSQTLGDAIAGGPIGQAFNTYIGNPIKQFLGSGEINSLKGRQEISQQLKILNQQRAQEKLGAVAAQNPALARQLDGVKSGGNIIVNAGSGGGGGGYSRSPSPYQRMSMARWVQQDADRFYEAKGRFTAASFESRFNSIEFPIIDRPQLNTYGYNADLPGFGSSTASQFLDAAKQSYQTNIIDDLQGKRDAAYASAKPALDAYRNLQSQQQAAYVKELQGAASPTAKLNVAAKFEQSLASTEKTVRSLEKSLKQWDVTLVKAKDNLVPFTNDSLASYTKGTFNNINGDIRATDQSRRYVLRDDLNQQQFQLKQDQQLGLISTSRFIQKDFANERKILGLRQTDFDNDVLLRQQQVDIYQSLADAETDPQKKAYYQGKASAYQTSVNDFKTQGQASLDELKAQFTPAQEAAQQRLVARKEISTNLQPFTNALVSGAYGGGVSGAIAQFGTAGKNAIAGVTNSVFADAIQNYASKVPGLQNILTGGLGNLPRNVADFFAMRSAPGGVGPVIGNGGGIFARGYQNLSNPANVSKVIGAGAVGTLASQYVLNQFPYANRGVSNVGNLAGTAIGGLLGGPIGAGIGAFAGGLIGAAPFTQNPVGGGLTGALAGAAGGFAFGGPIGALIGGIGGGILGLFGGKQAQEKKKQDKELARQQKLADQANGRNFAKSQIGLGADLASDLFDGYGTLAPKQAALTQFLGGSKLEAAASQQGLTGDALSAARSEFKRLGAFFQPVQDLATKYASVLDRPGGFQGAIYDETLKTQQIINRAPAAQQGPIGQLASTFESLRSNLGQYGFDTTRAQLAQNTFYSQYQNQLSDINYNIGVADRNFQDTNKQIQINQLSRGIQSDVLNKQYNEFDAESQKSIESALGTLQRRENRSAVVAKLKEDQAFQKNILGRQLDVFNKSSDLQQGQEFYQQQDALKNLDDLIGSRKALTDGFNELAPKLANAGDEFYKLNDAVKEVTRALEELSRNLRY